MESRPSGIVKAKRLRGLEVGGQLEVAPASPRAEGVHKEKPPRVAAAASSGALLLVFGFDYLSSALTL